MSLVRLPLTSALDAEIDLATLPAGSADIVDRVASIRRAEKNCRPEPDKPCLVGPPICTDWAIAKHSGLPNTYLHRRTYIAPALLLQMRLADWWRYRDAADRIACQLVTMALGTAGFYAIVVAMEWFWVFRVTHLIALVGPIVLLPMMRKSK